MTSVKFPTCGHKAIEFEIEFAPVTVSANVYPRSKTRYELTIYRYESSFSEDELRAYLFNPEQVGLFKDGVSAICPQCKERVPVQSVIIEDSCSRCGDSGNIYTCHHVDRQLCKKCMKDFCAICYKKIRAFEPVEGGK